MLLELALTLQYENCFFLKTQGVNKPILQKKCFVVSHQFLVATCNMHYQRDFKSYKLVKPLIIWVWVKSLTPALTFSFLILKNSQTYFKNFAMLTPQDFWKHVWLFLNIMKEKVKLSRRNISSNCFRISPLSYSHV